jgi:5-methylcytosine-specific restriction endonuclease McrA
MIQSKKMSRLSSAVSPDWINVREAVLRCDNYKCLECGTPCRAPEADVHHLLPRSAGGTGKSSITGSAAMLPIIQS